MNLFKLTWKNILARPLSTLLSLILIMLGVGLITFVLYMKQDFENQMYKNIKGIDMVVGAKGSPLQLILSAVFHIDAPTGNIKLKEAEKLRKNRFVKYAIPLSYGDSYNGYRIVGTDTAYSQLYNARLQAGSFRKSGFDVNLGATVAKNLNLQIGDKFSGSHGLVEGGEAHDENQYKVAGIFEPSNTVLDQLILTDLQSVWEVHGHAADEAHEDEAHEDEDEERKHEEHKNQEHKDGGHTNGGGDGLNHVSPDLEITAMLIKFRSPMGVVQLPRWVNAETNMQAAVPSYELQRLVSLMGVGIDTINSVAVVIMIVAGISVFISLFNSLKERQPELALMRSYGASRNQLAITILLEGLLISFLGYVMGLLLSKLGLTVAAHFFPQGLTLQRQALSFTTPELYLLVIVLTIGATASLIPVLQAIRLNISQTLSKL